MLTTSSHRAERCVLGFTLWECCVCLLLLSISFAGVQWKISRPAQIPLKKQVDIIHSKIRETRSLAAIHRTHARMLIHADERQPDLAYRSGILQVQTAEAPLHWRNVSEVWFLADDLEMIPKTGEASLKNPDYSSGMNRVIHTEEVPGWMSGVECYALEFKPTGRITSTSYVLLLGERGREALFYRQYRALRVNSYGQVCNLMTEADYEEDF